MPLEPQEAAVWMVWPSRVDKRQSMELIVSYIEVRHWI